MAFKFCLLLVPLIIQICYSYQIGPTIISRSDDSDWILSVDASLNDEDNNERKVVCNFWSQAWNRPGIGKYSPENIDESLCTHIVYNSANFNFTIEVNDPLVDIYEGLYRRVTDFKKKGIPVLISIGGYHDPWDNRYSRLVRNATARAYFVAGVIKFLEKYNFDGLEVHWEHPACFRTACIDVDARNEKIRFTELLRELSEEFKPRGLLLSAFVSPLSNVIPLTYDAPEISKYVDWLSVMSYYYYGPGNGQAKHFSLIAESEMSINAWIGHGAQRNKILMGFPMRGNAYILKDQTDHYFDAPVVGNEESGEYTQEAGCLSFFEIMQKVKANSFRVLHDSFLGTYAYLNEHWTSYNDVADIQSKAEYVIDRKLGGKVGGAMISALDEDDFRGDSSDSCGKYPLLTAANKVLRNNVDIYLQNCT